MKKLLSALLSVVMLFGMSASAFAAPATKITSFKGNFHIVKQDFGEIRPQDYKKDVVLAYFELADFDWSGTKTGNLTMSDLSSGKVKLRYKIKEGNKAISKVSLAMDKDKKSSSYNKPAILLKLNSVFPSLKETDFEIDIYVYVQGQGSQTDYGFTVTGTLANPVEEVEKGDTYVDMRDGHIAKFNASRSNFEFELTDEMSIWGNGVNKKQYWAYADSEPTESDDALIAKYPSIYECITLKTVNFTSSTFTVTFHDLEPSTQYVYTVNSNGQLLSLGKSSASLPLLSKYYLSSKEIPSIKKYTPPKTTSTSTKG